MISASNRQIVPMADMIPIIKEAVKEKKQVEMTVTGSSMMPLLIHCISSVRLTVPTELKKGDIVLFERRDGSFALHRISGLKNGFYNILGDNQESPDWNVPEKSIIAKVAAYNRKGRKWRESDRVYQVALPVLKGAKRFLSRVKRKLRN